jgi:hypothetical protein
MKPAAKQYLIEFGSAMLLYVVTMLFIMPPLFERIDSEGLLIWFAALIPMLPVALIVTAIVRFFRRQDELNQRIMGESHLISGMITIFASFAYGFLEIYAGAPALPMIWVLPVFWAMLIPITPLVSRRYR